MKKLNNILITVLTYLVLSVLTNWSIPDNTRDKKIQLFNIEKQLKIKEHYIDSVYSHLKTTFGDTINLNILPKNLKHIPTVKPVSQLNSLGLSCKYGWRHHPIKKIPIFHDGIDILGKYGTNIRATADGVILMTNNDNVGYGRKIIIDHGNGYKTLYGHLKCFNVNPGDSVKQYDIIGEMGNSGLSTGTHLHYEIHYNNVTINRSKKLTQTCA